MIDQESFWNEVGIEEDNTAVSFMGVEEPQLEQDEPEVEEQPTPEVPPTPEAPVADPVLEKLNALEARYAQLQAELAQSRQPVSPQPVQPQPPQQQQFQYQPSRMLNDADLAHYHMTVTQQLAEQQRQQQEMLHNVRVTHEKQMLESAKNQLKATRPDIFKYVDESLVEREFNNRVQRGQFGFDWQTGIETVYKISKFGDLEKASSELEQARQAKQAKQAKALKAVTPGGAPYQPAASQPAAGNGRGFKAASAGFLADIGLG